MVVIIDNYDSFTYNLVQYFEELDSSVHVFQNNLTTIEQIIELNPDLIVLSPGSGRPAQSGVSQEILLLLSDKIPVLGVCLGHQMIVDFYGGNVVQADIPVHGKLSLVDHDHTGIFSGLQNPTSVVRYHSLQAEEETLPACLRITARSEDDTVMGVCHHSLPVTGIQFHPESILSIDGKKMVENCYHQAIEWKRNQQKGKAGNEPLPSL